VMGSLFVAKRMGMENLISFDMGGTTAKACIVEHGRVTLATEYEVGAGLNVGHRLLRGGGYVVRVPILDIAEVGAGGGSIAWIAPGGILKVGPQSAGASPGPVCYGQGGTEPTVTDANVVLGYLNPAYLAGGALKLNAEAARRAVVEQIAQPLGLDPVEAAYGIHRIANAMMVRALRAVSIERGRDPRKFPLFAFGGSGPVHAAHLAQEMEMSRIVVPQAPGLFSSFGLLFSDLEHHYVQTFWHRFTEEAVDDANRALAAMATDARRDLAREGYGDGRVVIQAMADLRYVGQNSELSIHLPSETLERAGLAALREAFESEHETTYGYRSPKEPVQFVNLRLVARGLEERRSRVPGVPAASGRSASLPSGPSRRPAFFGPALGWVETAVIGRERLGSGWEAGPLIIEEYDSATVVPPGCRVARDEWGNILVDVAKTP
ncbi:MAG: hydantoinase/oxoprolinase family protein, partial [Dehalococcoidia bacterium]|nr:hydantoinase/oxoprolinase family protein [Dehalococcoidia bacterium]